jgi:hypothetical protein
MAQASARSSAKGKSAKRDASVAAIAAERFGAPRHDRRLTDKILAAFNHAYATGAVQTANHLKAVLAEVEDKERARYARRNATALSQADLWIAFVEARNRYNSLCETGDGAAGTEKALDAMKDAYRAWSEGV